MVVFENEDDVEPRPDGCDCGQVGFGAHDRGCALVALRKRPRVVCAKCECDDQPQAKWQKFRDMDWCASCEDNYDPPEPDGEDFRGGEAAAFQSEQMAGWQRLK